jgi:hypothetical protein
MRQSCGDSNFWTGYMTIHKEAMLVLAQWIVALSWVELGRVGWYVEMMGWHMEILES